MSRSKRNAAAAAYFERAPNYSTEAIPHLELWADRARRIYPVASVLCRRLASVLAASHKFALPVGGLTFEDEFGFSPSMAESFRLPYSLTAFEYEAPPLKGTEFKSRFHAVYCPKRIALCVDVEAPEWLAKGHEKVEPGAILFPINFVHGYWCPSWVCVVVPYMQSPVVVGTEEVRRLRSEASSLGVTREDGRDYSFRGTAIRSQFVPFGDFGRKLFGEYGSQETFWRATVDTRDELNASIQACAALACTNVTTEVIRPNSEARAARPGSTLFDYHVLVVDPGKVREPGEPLGGTHASPRAHLRRGHIRNHPTAGRIWVNSCAVNPTAIGTVNKDYAIRRGGRS